MKSGKEKRERALLQTTRISFNASRCPTPCDHRLHTHDRTLSPFSAPCSGIHTKSLKMYMKTSETQAKSKGQFRENESEKVSSFSCFLAFACHVTLYPTAPQICILSFFAVCLGRSCSFFSSSKTTSVLRAKPQLERRKGAHKNKT